MTLPICGGQSCAKRGTFNHAIISNLRSRLSARIYNVVTFGSLGSYLRPETAIRGFEYSPILLTRPHEKFFAWASAQGGLGAARKELVRANNKTKATKTNFTAAMSPVLYVETNYINRFAS